MSSFFQPQDLLASGPVIVVSLVAILVLVVEALKDKTETATCALSLGGFVVAFVWALADFSRTGTAYGGMLTTGGYASFFAMVFCAAGALTVMLSRSYIARQGIAHGEYYALMLFAVAGMMLMAGAADLIILFLGLELMSISFYICTAARDEQ